jgi:hypothetical protein
MTGARTAATTMTATPPGAMRPLLDAKMLGCTCTSPLPRRRRAAAEAAGATANTSMWPDVSMSLRTAESALTRRLPGRTAINLTVNQPCAVGAGNGELIRLRYVYAVLNYSLFQLCHARTGLVHSWAGHDVRTVC